jgi:Mg/Co/Ni transporter MgtE
MNDQSIRPLSAAAQGDAQTLRLASRRDRIAELTLKEPFSFSPAPLGLDAVVFLAMVGSCVASGLAGVLVPVTLKRLGADPATASSIFLTTATDVVSMGMLLGLGTVLIL